MNIFAQIITFDNLKFEKVTFHTIQIEGKNETEYENFILRHADIPEVDEDLVNLQTWIEIIGNKIGAKKEYFRNESFYSTTEALPPPHKKMKEFFVENLRVYCMRVNDNCVILFNGGIKTTDKAQECPNVGQFFMQANSFTKAIDKLIIEKEIKIDSISGDIVFDEGLIIEI